MRRLFWIVLGAAIGGYLHRWWQTREVVQPLYLTESPARRVRYW